jgi:ribonuclease J
MDLYAATIAAASGDPAVPQADWDDVAVYVPQSQRVKVKRSGQFERVDRVRAHRVYLDQLAREPGRFVLTFRGSMAREVGARMNLHEAAAIWSIWAGYLDNQAGVSTGAWFADHDIAIHQLHASGHASIEDLQRLARAVDADAVVPIHTDHPELFADHFARVARHDDGAQWSV